MNIPCNFQNLAFQIYFLNEMFPLFSVVDQRGLLILLHLSYQKVRLFYPSPWFWSGPRMLLPIKSRGCDTMPIPGPALRRWASFCLFLKGLSCHVRGLTEENTWISHRYRIPHGEDEKYNGDQYYDGTKRKQDLWEWNPTYNGMPWPQLPLQ